MHVRPHAMIHIQSHIREHEGGGGDTPVPFERVVNGDFATADGWNTESGWDILDGVATNTIFRRRLMTELNEPITSGLAFTVAVEVVANPLSTPWSVVVLDSVTSDIQVLYTDIGSGTGVVGDIGTINSTYDWLFIRTIDDNGLVIDNVSLMA